MPDRRFHARHGPFSLGDIARATDATLGPHADPARALADVAPLDDAAADCLSYCASQKYRAALSATGAGAVFVTDGEAAYVPEGVAALIAGDPQRAFAHAAALFYPAPRPEPGLDPRAAVDPGARIHHGCRIEAGAVVGAGAEIGEGSWIGPNAVIGPNVTLGRHCRIAANVVIQYAFLGDRVIVHPNAAIGQDGFGYASGPGGHVKIPQLGRVVLQDDVEVGANSAIDRGAFGDTVIGEGTKIDNLVQIGHNNVIGRHCIIAGRSGLSGSVTLGDYVVIGGGVGLADHIEIGEGAMIAAGSGVPKSVPAGAIYGGLPAKPIENWRRESAWLAVQARRKKR